MLSAETGAMLGSTELPTEALNVVMCQRTKNGCNILLKCDGESEYGYGKPLLAYNSELNLIWKHEDIIGSGHNLVCADIDGDGEDEILEGYALIDHDGSIIWAHDFPSHADQILVQDINNDGVAEVVYCTDFMDFFILDIHGKILYSTKEFVHPQQVSIGKFIGGRSHQLFLNNKACDGGSYMLDCKGNILWDFPCNGYSKTIKGGSKDNLLFCPSPGRLEQYNRDTLIARAKELGYKNMPLEKGDNDHPFILNGNGDICYSFSGLENCVDIDKWDLPRFIQNYYGAGFDTLIDDIDNDGEDEIIIYNRENIWIYKHD